MSLRRDTLTAARRGAALLPEGSAATVRFILDRLAAGGGFRGRGGEGDLYYTVFALDALVALEVGFPGPCHPQAAVGLGGVAGTPKQTTLRGGTIPEAMTHPALNADPPRERVVSFLRRFGGGTALDLVHLASLARCWAAVGGAIPDIRAEMLSGLQRFAARQGGYNQAPGADSPSAYGCFLAIGALQDLNAPLPNSDGMVRGLLALRTGDGGFANDIYVPAATTPTTAAAVVTLRALGQDVDERAAQWLLARQNEDGGFSAAPGVSSDLLSTATASHALQSLGGRPARPEDCRRFVLDLYDAGGFRGQAGDVADVEYTFYALLALGSW